MVIYSNSKVDERSKKMKNIRIVFYHIGSVKSRCISIQDK